MPLVDAYLARRALDYLVGFTLSPVLWRKLPGARSAGRVQSVALRLVCDRENEIETLPPARILVGRGHPGTAERRAVRCPARRLRRQEARPPRHPRRRDGAARSKRRSRSGSTASPRSRRSRVRRNPPPPFTTSTLQQEASRKLGFSAARTMQVAQRLYEGAELGGETVGLITYMRTDGVQIAPEAIAAMRAGDRLEFRRALPAGRGRGTTRPRPRTRRKRTRRSARPTSPAGRIGRPLARAATRRSSTT